MGAMERKNLELIRAHLRSLERQAPRCGARTRGGSPCQRPAREWQPVTLVTLRQLMDVTRARTVITRFAVTCVTALPAECH